MYSFVLPLLNGIMGAGQQAQASGEAATRTPMSTIMSFIPFVLIILIFYFLIIRPQNKKQKETQKMLAALKKGDKIVTIGGIHGTIQSVKESTVIVRVDGDTKLEFSRSAISNVEVVSKEENAELEAGSDKSAE